MSRGDFWAPVPGYPGYEVSRRGGVRSYLTNRWNGRSETPRVLACCLRKTGYSYVTLWKGKIRGESFGIHRLVLTAFIGPCPPGEECAHLNGIRTDNRLENLAWMTRAENIGHKIEHGTNGTKLNLKQVRAIRAAIDAGALSNHLARAFKVNETTITDIKAHRSWREEKSRARTKG